MTTQVIERTQCALDAARFAAMVGVAPTELAPSCRRVLADSDLRYEVLQGREREGHLLSALRESELPDLRVSGVILCMHETQTAHGKEVVNELDQFFEASKGTGQPWDGAQVFRPAIRRNVKLAESPSFGQTIFDYAPWCPGALDYRTLAERFVRDWERSNARGQLPELKPDAGPQATTPAAVEIRSATLSIASDVGVHADAADEGDSPS